MTLAQFKGLKREARRLAQTRGLTREQARERLAREEGFSDWATLTRSIEVPLKKETAC